MANCGQNLFKGFFIVRAVPINERMHQCVTSTFKVTKHRSRLNCNLLPRVLRLFGQRVGARRDSGELEYIYFCGKTMQAVTGQPNKKLKQNSTSTESLLAPTRRPKSLRILGTRLPHPATLPLLCLIAY